MRKDGFKQIEAFVNVVRFKSFSRAADATFLPSQLLSARISSSLEKELNTKLLDRKGRTVEMTPMVRSSISMQSSGKCARAQRHWIMVMIIWTGVFVSQTSTAGIAFLPEIIRKFTDAHPFTSSTSR